MPNIAAITRDIFSKGLPTLRETAVMPQLVRKDFKREVAEQGDTIKFPMPRPLTVKDVVPGPNSTAAESVTSATKSLVMDKWRMADFDLTDKQMAEVMSGSREYVDMQVAEAVRAVANDVNADLIGLGDLVPNVYLAGQELFADLKTTDAVGAAGKLNRTLCPRTGRNLVISNDSWDRALLVPNWTNSNAFGEREVVRDGKISTASGFGWHREDGITNFTVTGTSDNTVNGVNAQDSLILNVTTVTTLQGVGDAITIAGDPKFYSVIAVNGSALTLNEPLGQATTGGEVITTSGVAGTAYEQNLAFSANAFGLAGRLQTADGGQNDTRTQIVDPVTGLALMLRVEQQDHQWKWEVSTLFGVANLVDGCAARIFGTP